MKGEDHWLLNNGWEYNKFDGKMIFSDIKRRKIMRVIILLGLTVLTVLSKGFAYEAWVDLFNTSMTNGACGNEKRTIEMWPDDGNSGEGPAIYIEVKFTEVNWKIFVH